MTQEHRAASTGGRGADRSAVPPAGGAPGSPTEVDELASRMAHLTEALVAARRAVAVLEDEVDEVRTLLDRAASGAVVPTDAPPPPPPSTPSPSTPPTPMPPPSLPPPSLRQGPAVAPGAPPAAPQRNDWEQALRDALGDGDGGGDDDASSDDEAATGVPGWPAHALPGAGSRADVTDATDPSAHPPAASAHGDGPAVPPAVFETGTARLPGGRRVVRYRLEPDDPH